jgi:hypothetical protein
MSRRTPRTQQYPMYFSNTNAAPISTESTPLGPLFFDVVRHIHICNITGSAAAFTLYYAFPGEGSEIVNNLTVNAYSSWDWYGIIILTGWGNLQMAGAPNSTTFTITLEGETGVLE